MTEYKQQIGYFADDDKPTGKFMALYNDGSGGSLFMRLNGGTPHECYCTAEDIYDTVEYDWFVEAGYLMWVSIPDSYKLWCEND